MPLIEPVTYDLKKATITLLDGTTEPNTLQLKLDDGNLQFTIKRNVEYKLDRGVIDHTREGDEEPMEVSFECRFNAVKSSTGTPVTVMEFLQKVGEASAFETTGGACEPHAINIMIEFDQQCGEDVEDEIIVFEEFRYESIGGDFKAGTLSVSGKCNNQRPVAVRTVFAA